MLFQKNQSFSLQQQFNFKTFRLQIGRFIGFLQLSRGMAVVSLRVLFCYAFRMSQLPNSSCFRH